MGKDCFTPTDLIGMVGGSTKRADRELTLPTGPDLDACVNRTPSWDHSNLPASRLQQQMTLFAAGLRKRKEVHIKAAFH